MRSVERYGIFVLLVVLFLVINIIWPYLFMAVITVASLFTGLEPTAFLGLMHSL